ncbi:MAG TPA: hypothetical protein VGR73_23555 [Bryobacteraceae bacterium]|nr:hypothetical protein [Bryobacteraceae bacterium]
MQDEAWFLGDLLRTLYSWAKYPRLRAALFLDPGTSGGWVGIDEGEARFEFADQGWIPTSEKWSTFYRRVSDAFKEALESYERRLRSLMESRGYVRILRKETLEHFDWLVLWQIAGRTQAQIADWHSEKTNRSYDETRIRQGIEEAARLIGLNKLRPGERGPSRKPKLPT